MNWTYSDQWAAGFFDGEGCIQIERRPSGYGVSYYLNVQLTQNDVRPLEAVRDRFGGRITKASLNAKDRCFRWRASSAIAAEFLQQIPPHLLVKRERAERALALRALMGSKGIPATDQDRKLRSDAFESFRETFRR